jgi:uncharacterized glyoxalase superfamily protein PhnB
MHANVTEPGGTVVPTLRYRDVAAAIEWLCNAFGFERHLVVSGDNDAVRYAELTFGSGMIMLGPVEDSGLDKFMTQPADTGGAETQICYLFVADATAHCARSKAAGAEIVLDIEDAESNGRGYSCRDLEGHLWNFGTYDPWKRRPAPVGASNRYSAGLRGVLQRLAVAAGMVVVAIASAMVVGWALGVTDAAYLDLGTAASTSVAQAAANPQQDRLAREAAERTIKEVKDLLASERGAREAAERLVRSVREQLGQERTAKEAAERIAREIQAQLVREQSAKENAERVAKEASGHLARADAERGLADVRQQLARERSALESAQRIAQEARERLSLGERASDGVQEQLTTERTARAAAELAAQQTREQLAKEHAAKDAAARAAKEAREEQAKERVAHKPSPPPRPRPAQAPSSAKPFIKWD